MTRKENQSAINALTDQLLEVMFTNQSPEITDDVVLFERDYNVGDGVTEEEARECYAEARRCYEDVNRPRPEESPAYYAQRVDDDRDAFGCAPFRDHIAKHYNLIVAAKGEDYMSELDAIATEEDE